MGIYDKLKAAVIAGTTAITPAAAHEKPIVQVTAAGNVCEPDGNSGAFFDVNQGMSVWTRNPETNDVVISNRDTAGKLLQDRKYVIKGINTDSPQEFRVRMSDGDIKDITDTPLGRETVKLGRHMIGACPTHKM